MSANLDILGMSDEDFKKLAGPPQAPASKEPAAQPEPVANTAPVETQEQVTAEVDEAGSETTDTQETQTTPEDEGTEPESEPEGGEQKTEPEAAPVKTQETAPAAEPERQDPPPEVKKEKEKPTDQVDYKAFYERLMAPFKANGKTIQLQSVDEAIQLMQMGANYTKKMQSIQHTKKFVMMLENNGLLDESKLSFLIDLDKKNPEAIRKFFKDSNIDPVDVDTSGEIKYKTGSHAVSDQEVTLAAAIDDIKSMPGGTETLQVVQGWDSASKKALWENPELLSTIHAHRGNGVYSRISTEIERQQALGQIRPNVPFLQAYKMVGDALMARVVPQPGTKPATSAPVPVAVRTPVAVRPASTPATKAPDNSKVRAAAVTRSAPKPAQVSVNILAMDDEEFLKIKKPNRF